MKFNYTDKLKNLWHIEPFSTVNDDDITSFETKYGLLLPEDLISYFKDFNGTNDEYDENLFRFFSFSQFKSISEELIFWNGVPDYSDIGNTLQDFDKYFVIVDYQFHLYTYVIRLYSIVSKKNDVLVLCGSEFEQIANSFSEFLDLYLAQSTKLNL
jgi:hypothetical protein